MLSPKALNLVTASRGDEVTVTLNVQEAVLCWASVAAQLTAVVPTTNLEPLAGVQTTVTGGAPSVTTGDAKATATG